MKMLIKCPICEYRDGQINFLAEYNDDGSLSILRYKAFHNRENISIIVGNDFALVCGKCKEVAFKKTPVLIQQTTQITFGTIYDT